MSDWMLWVGAVLVFLGLTTIVYVLLAMVYESEKSDVTD